MKNSQKKTTKYIFILGGVLSSLGKGVASASIASIIESQKLKVTMMKMDPYINVDPGTMNPFQHGEVYVTDDGSETDLDLGHYYRYSQAQLSSVSSITSGKIYNSVINKERQGLYLGETVQVIPHITDEIKKRILHCAQSDQDVDVVLIEVGGTVGDIESQPFLEAVRQFIQENNGNTMVILLTYVPKLTPGGEVKTKPTQQSVNLLRGIGIAPDVILCRSTSELHESIKKKISLFCGVKIEYIFDMYDVKWSIYEIPLNLHKQFFHNVVNKKFNFKNLRCDLSNFEEIIRKIKNAKKTINIAVVGKYTEHHDAYKSVMESLAHGGIANDVKVNVVEIRAEEAKTEKVGALLKNCMGCLVPGGFGIRGWQGMIEVAKYCRNNGMPYFGICLGMHAMLVEFGVNVAKIKGGNSMEFEEKNSNHIISLMDNQKGVIDKGGSMRLGAYECNICKNSKAYQAYRSESVSERHRHRYEFNHILYKKVMESCGMKFSGICSTNNLCEIAEIVDHLWMIGVQFHPEFKSKPTSPHPLFVAFIEKSMQWQK